MDNLCVKIKNSQRDYKEKGAWVYFNSDEVTPSQGWKIHISSQLKDSVNIFDICQKVLFDKNCQFKVAKDMETLKKINSPRETSPTANKFITIYTKDAKHARELILELVNLLDSFDSPKILSDFQCGKSSPVHYRFGAYKEIKSYNQQTHEVIYMLKNDIGKYVEDVRNSYFSVPDWEKDLYLETRDDYYKSICQNLVQEIMSLFFESTEIDFALGQSGILHALIKYSIVFKDKYTGHFIEKNIYKLADFLKKCDINENLDTLACSFAHGISGIAYTLHCYTKIFSDNTYQGLVERVNNHIVKILEKFSVDYKKIYNNLELSWCEGISGLILYLCLINPLKYKIIIEKA